MKGYKVALALVGLLLAGSVSAQQTSQTQYCAGAEGNSKACAQGCSGTRGVNDEVVPNSNQGTFNVGNGNQGDGNDGFNNVGNFNVGSGNQGNCLLRSGGQTGDFCDPSNAPGQIVLRFCHVYPNDNKCQPAGYLPQYSSALKAQLPAIVASCSGVVPTTLVAGTPLAPGASTTAGVGSPPSTLPTAIPLPPRTLPTLPVISDSTADLATLLALLDEHIRQDNLAGRRLKM